MTMTARKKDSRPSLTPPAVQPDETFSRPGRQFEANFIAYWPQVVAFLMRLVGDQAEAEDLALETFLRLYRRPPQAPAAGEPGTAAADPLGGWLHRVAANLGLNAIRGWQRRQRYELSAGRNDLWERQQFDSGPAELFQAEEERLRVRRILAGMHPRQARLLLLRHSGLPYRDLAAELGVAVTSIGPLLARAEHDFERRFRAAYPEEEGDHAPD